MGFIRVVLLCIAVNGLIDSIEATPCTIGNPNINCVNNLCVFDDDLPVGTEIWSVGFTDGSAATAQLTNEAQRQYFTLTPEANVVVFRTTAAFANILDAGALTTFLPQFSVQCAGTPGDVATSTFAHQISITDTNNQPPQFVGPEIAEPLNITVNLATWEELDVINEGQPIALQDGDLTPEFANIKPLLVEKDNGEYTDEVSIVDPTFTMTRVEAERLYRKDIQLHLKNGLEVGTYKFRLFAANEAEPQHEAYYYFNVNVIDVDENGASQIGAMFLVTIVSVITTWINL